MPDAREGGGMGIERWHVCTVCGECGIVAFVCAGDSDEPHITRPSVEFVPVSRYQGAVEALRAIVAELGWADQSPADASAQEALNLARSALDRAGGQAMPDACPDCAALERQLERAVEGRENANTVSVRVEVENESLRRQIRGAVDLLEQAVSIIAQPTINPQARERWMAAVDGLLGDGTDSGGQ